MLTRVARLGQYAEIQCQVVNFQISKGSLNLISFEIDF